MVGYPHGSSMAHRYFFPQMTLDTWLVDEQIDLRGTELTPPARVAQVQPRRGGAPWSPR